ncbi:hypothetical protein K2X85_14140 [bacterium]|nr:hypothetical protein [bacterium]
MPAVLEKARRDREQGQLWLARKRLASYISSSGYDHLVLDLLGEVCYEMGDFPAAGRYWFFVELRNDRQRDAVAVFLRQAGRRPEQIGKYWPTKLRYVRLEKLPADARDRLAAVVHHIPMRRPPPIQTHRSYTPRDQLISGVALLVALFFLYCFSVGFAHVIGLK